MTDLRIVHWDYKEFDVIAEADSNIQMLTGLLRDVNTDEKSGYYIRWALRVFIEDQLTLSCLAETTHKQDVYSISVDDFIETTKTSQRDFKAMLGYRIKTTNLTIGFQVEVTHEEASLILQQLREQ